jgi:nodulation protein E
MTRQVVITGVGCISALGLNVRGFWSALTEGRSAIRRITGLGPNLKIGIGAQVEDYRLADHFSDQDLVLLDRFSQLAVIAAREAVCDAGLSPDDDRVSRSAAIIGTGCGGKQTDEETYRQLYQQEKTRVHPLTIPKGMPSAAASMVSRDLGIRGPVFSVTSACASGAHAVIQGGMMIRAGLVDIAVVGATDAPFTYGLLTAWEAVRVISNDTCRPFSRDRSGMVLGEGAGIVVLESLESAVHRGARIYAAFVGAGMSSDAGHITRPDVEGISQAMTSALEDAGLPPRSVGYVNAHGTGTQANDPVETEAIHKVFGEHAKSLLVSSTKSMHGHALGASSALELIATALTIHHGIVPPTANFTEPGDGCDLDYVPRDARYLNVDVALSNAFAFGGLNATIVLSTV